MGKLVKKAKPATSKQVASVLMERDLAQARFETLMLQQQTEMLESLNTDNGWGSFVGNSERGETARDNQTLFPVEAGDRRRQDSIGAYVQDVEMLTEIRAQARILFETNPVAGNIITNYQNYVVGDGMVPTVSAREEDEAAVSLAQDVQFWLEDNFYVYNDFINLQLEDVKRSHRDGESALRHFPQADGLDRLVIIEPEQFRTPLRYESVSYWSWGLRNAAFVKMADGSFVESLALEEAAYGGVDLREDRATIVQYGISYDVMDTTWEAVDAKYVDFLKINTDIGIKRGLSSFWAIGKTLEGVAKLVRNLHLGAAGQAALLGFIEYATATSDAVSQLVAGQRESVRSSPKYGGGTISTSQIRMDGPVLKHLGRNQQYKAPPFWSQNSVNHMNIVQGALRFAGTAFNFPEYMITGSAENANYASSLVAGSPFVREIIRWQGIFKRRYSSILWKALQFAFNAGVFSKHGVKDWETFKRLLRLELSAPMPEIREQLEEAQIDDMDMRNGVLSKESRRKRRNLNNDVEEKNLEKERKEAMEIEKERMEEGLGAPAPVAGKKIEDPIPRDDKHLDNKKGKDRGGKE